MATDIIKTIAATSSPVAPDYSTLQSWEDALPANLVTADQRHIGECLDQGEFTSSAALLSISGQTTDATRNIILRCASGASFKDKAGVRTAPLRYDASQGVAARCTGATYIIPAFYVATAYTRIEGLQLRIDGTTSTALLIADANTVIDSCILSGGRWAVRLSACKLVNCLIVGTKSASQAGVLNGSTTIHGCTIVNCTTGLNLGAYSTAVLKNAAVFDCTTAFTGTGTRFNGSDYVATDAASVPGSGTHNVTSLTFSDQFENTTNDFRAKSTGDLQAGTPDLTNTPDDITGLVRNVTTPWIGCWEVSGGSVFNPFWVRHKTQIIGGGLV